VGADSILDDRHPTTGSARKKEGGRGLPFSSLCQDGPGRLESSEGKNKKKKKIEFTLVRRQVGGGGGRGGHRGGNCRPAINIPVVIEKRKGGTCFYPLSYLWHVKVEKGRKKGGKGGTIFAILLSPATFCSLQGGRRGKKGKRVRLASTLFTHW